MAEVNRFLLIDNTDEKKSKNKYGGYECYDSSCKISDYKYILLVGHYKCLTVPETSYVSWIISEEKYIDIDNISSGEYDNVDTFFTDFYQEELKERFGENNIHNFQDTLFFNHRLSPPHKSTRIIQNLEELSLKILNERITFDKVDSLKKDCSIQGLTGKKYETDKKAQILVAIYDELYGDKSIINRIYVDECHCNLFESGFKSYVEHINREYYQTVRYKKTNDITLSNTLYVAGFYEFIAGIVYNHTYLKYKLNINMFLDNFYTSSEKWLGIFYNNTLMFPSRLDENCRGVIVFTDYHRKVIDDKYDIYLLDYPFLEEYPLFDIKEYDNSVSCSVNYKGVVENCTCMVLLYKCLQINNPVYVKKTELTTYILGENYPLYKNTELNHKNVCKAYNYMKRMDKSRHSKDLFRARLLDILENKIET
jgi:hypothetical protein